MTRKSYLDPRIVSNGYSPADVLFRPEGEAAGIVALPDAGQPLRLEYRSAAEPEVMPELAWL